jgi:hypothetical protein
LRPPQVRRNFEPVTVCVPPKKPSCMGMEHPR